MSSGRIRILIVGEAGVNTGFSRVISSIFTPLADRFELRQVAPGFDPSRYHQPWPIAPAGSDLGFAVCRGIKDFRPDILFLLMSMGHQHQVLDHIRSEMPVPRTIAYCPVESGPLDPEVLLSFDGVSACVAFTTFAATELNRAIDAARRLHATVDIPEIQIIPHGVDTHTFRPLDARDASLRGREWAKRHLFEARPDLWNAFVVLNANRNQPRKRMDITLLAFALFAQRKRDVALLLHTEPEGRGWNVPALARQLGIAERVVLTTASADAHSASDFHLNLVYNSADVGLNTATAEGWGLVSMEHAATGAAQVMPRHTALAEIWAGAAEFVEPTVAVVHSAALNREYIVSPEAVAAALERLYADRSYLRDRAAAAHRVALDDRYRWDAISTQWRALFQRT